MINEPHIAQDEEEWDEVEWVWSDESSFDKLRRFITLGSQRKADLRRRSGKRTVVRRYDSNGQVISEEKSDSTYTDWDTVTTELHNGWGDDPGDDYIVMRGQAGVFFNIPLDNKDKPISQPSGVDDSDSTIAESSTPSLRAQAVDGYEWDSFSVDRSDDPLGQFYAAKPMANDYLVPTDIDGFGVGDVILNIGVTPEMVMAAGFKFNSSTKFVTISKSQLMSSKVPNTVGHIPTKYDFLIVTDFSVIKERNPVNISSDKGQITITRGTVRSYVEAYLLSE